MAGFDMAGYEWLEANGITRTDLAIMPIAVVDGEIIYYTFGWGSDTEDSGLRTWGGEPVYCQRRTPLIVPPAPGLLEGIRRACRRQQLRELMSEALRMAGE